MNNGVLAIFREWNALLGKNKWNLPEVNERTLQRWLNESEPPSGIAARKVAAKVWLGTKAKGQEKVREGIIAVVRRLAPQAPVDSWDDVSCGAWFFTMAEEARNNSPVSEGQARLDPSALVALRDEYLKWLIRECGPLQLKAIDQSASRPEKEAIGLASVYVDLNLDFPVPKEHSLAEHLKAQAKQKAFGETLVGDFPRREQNEVVRKVIETEAVGQPGRHGEKGDEMRLVAVLEALATHDKFVLLGAPGSGKSTVTAFVALQLARALLNQKGALEKLGRWWTHGPLLPVRVVLRQFAAQLPKNLDRGRAGHLWAFIRSEVNYDGRADQTVECLREMAKGSGALFLLDGLDEVREEMTRRRMLEAVAEFATTAGPRCRFVLTSRPYAWESLEANERAARAASPRETPETLTDIHVAYRLAPLQKEQIETFITRWYEALDDAHWITKAEANAKRGELIAAKDRPDLFELARNPLLLTLMATLHSNRARLPDDRADLYNEVVELLLQRWNETCGADRGLLDALQISSLKLGDLREVLEQLAFDAHSAHAGKPGVADIPEQDLVKGLRPLLGGSADKAEIALDYIERRAGLLLGQGERGSNRQYAFPHRTFQEYLAACHLAGRPDFCQRAADLARENPAHWKEVLPLAARHAKAGRGVPAADALVGCIEVTGVRDGAITDADWRATILAGEQLLEIGSAAVDSRPEHCAVRDRIARWLGALLERGRLPVNERARAGEVLGELGDLRAGVGTTDTGIGRPSFLWCGAKGEVANAEGAREKAFPPQRAFKMGEPKSRKDRAWGSFMQFDCTRITKAFFISKYPVTVAQYQLFVDDEGYEREEFWTGEGWAWRKSRKVTGPENYAPEFQTPNHPRVGVSWFEARAYCGWLNRAEIRERLGRDLGLPEGSALEIGLPIEAEWELAARWSHQKGRADDRPFPWGDEGAASDLTERCNWGETKIGHTSAVGMFPKGNGECGAADLSGNVWEWCQTKWIEVDDKTNLTKYNSGLYDEDVGEGSRVLRGGSWGYDDPDFLRAAYRYVVLPGYRVNVYGFRVVLRSGEFC